jgi:hypothetical protein
MTIVILSATDANDEEYGLLANPETERTIPVPLFAGGKAAAKDFLEFARCTMRGDHLESLTAAQWEKIHDAWLRVACSECFRRDCACVECGLQCDVAHAEGCREGAQ